MAENMNADKVKELAQNMVRGMSEDVRSQREKFKEFMQAISKESDMTGFNELAALLALNDDAFELIAPVFLNELAAAYNNVNDAVALAQSMNAAGMTIEDVRENFQQLSDEIDRELGDTLSRSKKDFFKKMLMINYNAIAETEGIAKKTIMIPIEYCHPNAKMPAYAHLTDAGMDVYALEDITIQPGETKLIPTGIKMAIPNGYEVQVRPKSGRCLKTKLRIANTPGTIDAGYRDEIGVIIDNIDPFIKGLEFRDGKIEGVICGEPYTIGKGEKFAQLVLSEVPKAAFVKVDSVERVGEDRGGGFGSTGLK